MGQLKRSCETQIHCWAGENSTSGINLLGGARDKFTPGEDRSQICSGRAGFFCYCAPSQPLSLLSPPPLKIPLNSYSIQ